MATSRNNGVSIHTRNAFFELLRSGLWGYVADIKQVDKKTDWEAVFRLAHIQTVAGLVFDGLITLPEQLHPDADLFKREYAFVVKIEQSHALLNSVLADIYSLYRDKGFTPVLLKGQGVAQCYPNPLRRQCGDIDLYIGEKDYESASQLVKSMTLGNKHTVESVKHLHFKYRGGTIENHRYVALLYNSRNNRYFENMVNQWFPDKARLVLLNGSTITLPPAHFDAIFILIHASVHFFAGGIGLRQLCDWLRVLHTFNNQMDLEQLQIDLKGLGYDRIWAVFACMSVQFLGFPKEEMPFYNPKYADKANKAMNIILIEGNFGFNIDKGVRPTGYLSGKFYTFRNVVTRWTSVSSIFPKESLVYLLHYVKSGIRQIIKDKL